MNSDRTDGSQQRQITRACEAKTQKNYKFVRRRKPDRSFLNITTGHCTRARRDTYGGCVFFEFRIVGGQLFEIGRRPVQVPRVHETVGRHVVIIARCGRSTAKSDQILIFERYYYYYYYYYLIFCLQSHTAILSQFRSSQDQLSYSIDAPPSRSDTGARWSLFVCNMCARTIRCLYHVRACACAVTRVRVRRSRTATTGSCRRVKRFQRGYKSNRERHGTCLM